MKHLILIILSVFLTIGIANAEDTTSNCDQAKLSECLEKDGDDSCYERHNCEKSAIIPEEPKSDDTTTIIDADDTFDTEPAPADEPSNDDTAVNADATCSDAFSSIENDFSAVVKTIEAQNYSAPYLLTEFAKCLNYSTVDGEGVHRISESDKTAFLTGMNALDDATLTSFVSFLDGDQDIYNETCRQIVEMKNSKPHWTIDRVIRTVISSQTSKMEELKQMDELISSQDSTTNTGSLIQQIYKSAVGDINSYLQAQAENRQRRAIEEAQMAEMARVQAQAISEANTEKDQVFNKYRLFSPKKRDRASISKLTAARTELSGHINSYTKQMNESLDAVKALKAKLSGDAEAQNALRQQLEGKVTAQVNAAQKAVVNAKATYEALKESHPGSMDETKAKIAYDKATRDFNELKAAYESGALQKNINAQLAQGAQNQQATLMEIAKHERNAAAAQVKAQTLTEGLSQIDMWIMDKQDREEYEVERDQDMRDYAQSNLQRPGSSGSGLIPTRGRARYSRSSSASSRSSRSTRSTRTSRSRRR